MSYSIIYGRQYIKTSRGIIPLILEGESNVSMFSGMREVRARDWQAWAKVKGRIELREEEICSIAEARYGGRTADEEVAVRLQGRTGFPNGESLRRYLVHGIKYAMPIESIVEILPRQALFGWIGYEACGSYKAELSTDDIRTTPELEDWIDAATCRIAELEAHDTHADIHLIFKGHTPLNIESVGRSRTIFGPVYAKLHHCYVTAYSNTSVSTQKHAVGMQNAIRFDSVADAESKLPKYLGPYAFEAAKYTKQQILKAPMKEKNL